MMTLEMVIELLKSAKKDIFYDVDEEERDVYVTVKDFKGFDDDWHEISRDYDKDLVKSIEEKIEAASVSSEGDLYRYYQFEDFTVVWGYSSFDV